MTVRAYSRAADRCCMHHLLPRRARPQPANVMLNSKGAVKITDFGITSQLLNTAGYASTFVGTTIYMAPERLQGDKYT